MWGLFIVILTISFLTGLAVFPIINIGRIGKDHRKYFYFVGGKTIHYGKLSQ